MGHAYVDRQNQHILTHFTIKQTVHQAGEAMEHIEYPAVRISYAILGVVTLQGAEVSFYTEKADMGDAIPTLPTNPMACLVDLLTRSLVWIWDMVS